MSAKVQSLVATRKLRGPVKWHGGKSYLARRIVGLFPPHDLYCEPFLGGGSVLLNKEPAKEECAADLNAGLIRMWKALAKHPAAVVAGLYRVPYTAEQFAHASHRVESDLDESGVDHAVRFIVRNRFSRGGLGKSFAWSDRLRGGQPGDANAWDTIRAEMPAIGARIARVEFRCDLAVDVIERWDSSRTLFYLDPPYLHETRTARDAYDHEMTRDHHGELLDLVRSCKGKVAISGYRSALYGEALAGWNLATFDMPNHSSQSKQKARRTECLWMNY